MQYLLLIGLTLCTLTSYTQKNYSLEDVYKKGIFQPKRIAQFHSTLDGQHYTEAQSINGDYSILKKSFSDESYSSTLFSSDDVQVDGIDHHAFSGSENIILLFSDPDPIYRHSTRYRTHLYDIKKSALIESPEKQVLHPDLSPDEKKLCYIDNNNMYLLDLSTSSTKPITTDGKTNQIINGNCDWVYEEEFGFTQAYQWSPSSKYIAYYKFDESEVSTFTMQYYEDLYPRNYTYKYPKAGEDNSVLSLWLYDVTSEKQSQISLPISSEYYIPRIYWTPQNELLILTLNRLQNHLQYWVYTPSSGKIRNIYSEKDKRYVEVGNPPLFLDNNTLLICSEKSGYNHLYSLDLASGNLKQLTQGSWEIRESLGAGKDGKYAYFTATKDGINENHCYQLNLKNKKIKKITQEAGYHTVSFSQSMDYFLDEYSNTSTPPQYILKTNNGNTVRYLEDNIAFGTTYKQYSNTTPHLIKIPLSSGSINGLILKPLDFDPEKKYPVLMYQYSGPGSQQVKNSFYTPNHYLHQILTQKGYVVVIADGRGTGAQGAEYKKQTYEQLGKLESDDQIAVAQWLQKQKYVDSERIGIWGWSYGGYMSSICIMKGADIFKTAIAVAPVTNWRFYDNIYTERYMGLPKDNPQGYDLNSPTSMVEKLKGNYLIVHGLADDNVHFQNSAALIDKLISADKQFDSEIYPNQAHGMGTGRYHLYNRIIDYISQHL